jgi:acyl-CoA thioesterase-2
MSESPLDLSHIFELEPHGPDTFIGESPAYSWGRIFGGLVIAQALLAATRTVEDQFAVHSLHAYFILGGDLREPVRYEVDRVRNGRSFCTRRVSARQSGGAILTLGCSYHIDEDGPETQSAVFPSEVLPPDDLPENWDAGCRRRSLELVKDPPRSRCWVRMPDALDDDPVLHACALAYLSDMNMMGAVHASHPAPREEQGEWMGASLDHSIWFHRSIRADEWILNDVDGHGMIRNRGLATGRMFDQNGTHAATIAQEGLLRPPRGSKS